jgi:hypothetical protein
MPFTFLKKIVHIKNGTYPRCVFDVEVYGECSGDSSQHRDQHPHPHLVVQATSALLHHPYFSVDIYLILSYISLVHHVGPQVAEPKFTCHRTNPSERL